MKNFVKKLVVLITTFSLLAVMSIIPVQAGAKSTYWLTGISKQAGGNMRMYYKVNTITLQGKIRRSDSIDTVSDAAEKKSSYKLKVAKNCKVHLIEAENDQVITYGQWAKNDGYKDTADKKGKGKEATFISATFKVKGKKIVEISFSA